MIKPINELKERVESVIINPCPLPCICDGETCKGGWCHVVCWGD